MLCSQRLQQTRKSGCNRVVTVTWFLSLCRINDGNQAFVALLKQWQPSFCHCFVSTKQQPSFCHCVVSTKQQSSFCHSVVSTKQQSSFCHCVVSTKQQSSFCHCVVSTKQQPSFCHCVVSTKQQPSFWHCVVSTKQQPSFWHCVALTAAVKPTFSKAAVSNWSRTGFPVIRATREETCAAAKMTG